MKESEGKTSLDRELVRKLFDFNALIFRPIWQPFLQQLIGVMSIAVAITTIFLIRDQFADFQVIGFGLIAASIFYIFFEGVLFVASVVSLRAARGRRQNDVLNYAEVTYAIQASDYARAFRRVFERAKVDTSLLKRLNNAQMRSGEQYYFPATDFEPLVGDLFARSIRFIAQGDFGRFDDSGKPNYLNRKRYTLYWEDNGKRFEFLNPIWSIALYLTSTEVIVCSVEIDSIDQDLRESIIRIQVSDIVEISFDAERIRAPMSKAQTLDWAKSEGFSIDVYRHVEQNIASAQRARAAGRQVQSENSAGENFSNYSPYFRELVSGSLIISKTDGKELRYPLHHRSEVRSIAERVEEFGQQTDEELSIDAIVHELNRAVRAVRANPGVDYLDVEGLEIFVPENVGLDGGARTGKVFSGVPRFSPLSDYDPLKGLGFVALWGVLVLAFGIIAVTFRPIANGDRLGQSGVDNSASTSAFVAEVIGTELPSGLKARALEDSMLFGCTAEGIFVANIRSGPGTSNEVVAALAKGEVVLVDRSDYEAFRRGERSWLGVTFDADNRLQRGFVSGNLLNIEEFYERLRC